MVEANKTEEILSALKLNGPAFYGSNDTQAAEIAEEWADTFDTAAEAIEWMAAGFWCPDTAEKVSQLGIEPQQVAGLCNDNITGSDDPVYEMCNSDLSVDALVG